MKKSLFFLVSITITSLLFLTVFSLYAQKKETEFWLTFGRNNTAENYWSANLQIRIVSGENPTTGIIYFTALDSVISFSMNANTIFTFPLDDNTLKQAVYNTTMGKSNKSIRINSSEPVRVYAMNSQGASIDATNLFPVEVLDNSYYQISYGPDINRFDGYAVVAVRNNTQLLQDGVYLDTLNAGEVYYHTSSTDMTGSCITANNPVAFFVVNSCASIPTGTCDHLFQQLAPVNTWGKNFFVPVSHRAKDRVRIVAMKDTTTITQTDGLFVFSSSGNYTINKGQYIELEILLDNNGCSIHADKPVGVCTYLTTASYPLPPPYESDPAIAWLPPVEQYLSNVLVTPFYPTGIYTITKHYALVVTPTETRNDTEVSIGGASSIPLDLISGTWYEHSSGYSFFSLPLANNSYRFTNDNSLAVMGYGVGQIVSYYYLGGSNMRDLEAVFYGNDIYYKDLTDTAFCAGEITFRAEIENMGVDMDSIKWYINGIKENLPHTQLEWSKTFSPDNYEIRMWIRFENNDTISKIGTLKIKSCDNNAAFYVNNVHYENLPDTVFCAKDVYFRAEIEGQYEELKWFINNIEEVPAQNQEEWNKQFETGDYEIKLWVRYENGDTATITNTLRMEVFWVKIRNVRY